MPVASNFQTHQTVLPTIFEEHHGVIFKHVFIVSTYLPVSWIVCEREVPTADVVARSIGVALSIRRSSISGITPHGNEGFKEVFKARAHLEVSGLDFFASPRYVVGMTSELGGHLQGSFKVEGERLLVSNLQVTGFHVVQSIQGVALSGRNEVALPIVVGVHAIAEETFDVQPVTCAGDGDVLGEFKAYLGHRTCVGAEDEASATE